MVNKLVRYGGQAVAYVLFAGFVGYFATSPAYTHLPPDLAVIKVSFSHPAKPAGECRQRTAEELAKLPPNMRVPTQCPRERSPVQFEFEIDGKIIHSAELQPSGIAKDGAAMLYKTFPVPAGEHTLRARLRDDIRAKDFTYAHEERVTLKPAQVYVVDFNAKLGGFNFR